MKIMLIAGARPNFMKIASLMKAIHNHNSNRAPSTVNLTPLIVHTGQHYDLQMSQVFFRELDIPSPDINLEVGSGSHAVQTANIMIRFEEVCLREEPDYVVVVGDVNSTMACTLVASKLGYPVAHVEAGLRSFDRTMPEEINRIVTDSLADLLFTPSPDADENLKKEGIPDSRIKLVGNIMIDTLVTLHRPSNVDDREAFTNLMEQLDRLASLIPVVFPVHPRTGKTLATLGIEYGKNDNFKIMDPIGYHDSICLAEHARFVITDSGGLQEETTFFGTPCLTLRPNTERPITITEGSNRLTSPDRLWYDIENLLNGHARKGKVPHLWDGKTAERIVQHLCYKSG
jgi:UDP-N-acetylglucosamine 2-epimerase (non-hydrolysing)